MRCALTRGDHVTADISQRSLSMWFTGWQPVGRAVLFSSIAYVCLIALVRMLGHRTLSKMNPGDFIVTVAIGSVTADLILLGEISLAQGLTALTSLLAIQFITEWNRAHGRPPRGGP